jgi:hypothetical protein
MLRHLLRIDAHQMKTILPSLSQLRIMVRTHNEVGLAVCALCGQPNDTAKTSTGLYDGAVHLGDICKQCLHGGRRGASARTRSHCAELRRLAVEARASPKTGQGEQCCGWLQRYAEFLENLAARVEGMTEWIPRPGS